ncbi:MAG: hypothetical protein ACYC9M_10915 [Desulfobulbaceae bacterium]
MKKLYSTTFACAALVLAAGAADAATRVYTSPKYVFSLNDVQCDTNLTGTACLETTNPQINADFFKDSYTHYGIDSAYGFNVRDFDPSVAMYPRPRDGVFEEGYVANILDGTGNVIGIDCKNDETPGYLTGIRSLRRRQSALPAEVEQIRPGYPGRRDSLVHQGDPDHHHH